MLSASSHDPQVARHTFHRLNDPFQTIMAHEQPRDERDRQRDDHEHGPGRDDRLR